MSHYLAKQQTAFMRCVVLLAVHVAGASTWKLKVKTLRVTRIPTGTRIEAVTPLDSLPNECMQHDTSQRVERVDGVGLLKAVTMRTMQPVRSVHVLVHHFCLPY